MSENATRVVVSGMGVVSAAGHDLETFRRVDPDWLKLRNLWMEMEFVRLVKATAS